jgi:V8-like Glu-specific endopeptidase
MGTQGVRFEEIWSALESAYSSKSLEQMLRFCLNKSLFDLVPEGSMREMVYYLLQQAYREGWITELVSAAYLFNPANPSLLRLYERYHLAPAVSVQSGTSASARRAQLKKEKLLSEESLEETFKKRIPTLDIAFWRERMASIEGRVCRIEIDGEAVGTGFLVGPDAVLTAYHVLEPVLEGKKPASKVVFRFDYKVLYDGTKQEGVCVKLHRKDWKLDFSPPSAAEKTRTPDNPPPAPDELDYALVKLERRLGEEPLMPSGSENAPKRGWLVLPVQSPDLTTKTPLIIAQHSSDKTLKLAIDTESVIGVNANRTRVRYKTNTERGSSGSPVFDMRWNLVALHQMGDPAYSGPASYNQGVVIDQIRRRIESRGKSDSLGAA